MGSVVTNFGKASSLSALLAGVLASGAALPATFYFILIDNTYDFDNTNPDHDDITDITGRMDPANYSGNSIAVGSANWTKTVDDTNNKGTITPASTPRITAGAALNNIKGFAITDADSIVTAKVYSIHQFTTTFSLSIGQFVDLTSVGIEGQAP